MRCKMHMALYSTAIVTQYKKYIKLNYLIKEEKIMKIIYVSRRFSGDQFTVHKGPYVQF